MEITVIAALAENRVIGKDGKMPWHYPVDLKRFKELTMGHPVIMGRVTYESILAGLGEPLPGRTTIVLTNSPDSVDASVTTDDDTAVTVAISIEDALTAAAETRTDEVFVAGGATVYEQFLPQADRLELTEIHETYVGDTRFPPIDEDSWEEVAREDRVELSFVTYERAT